MIDWEKLARADTYLRSVGLSCNTDKTILYRFLRSRGVALKPVYWESFHKNVVLKFTEFFIVYLAITYLFSLAQDEARFIDTFFSAVFISSAFSFVLSLYYHFQSRRNGLKDWNNI